MIGSNILLNVVCLDENENLNQTYPLPGVIPERPYLVMGQVALQDKGIGHYILMDFLSGKFLPGMFHDDRFRYVTENDDFF